MVVNKFIVFYMLSMMSIIMWQLNSILGYDETNTNAANSRHSSVLGSPMINNTPFENGQVQVDSSGVKIVQDKVTGITRHRVVGDQKPLKRNVNSSL